MTQPINSFDCKDLGLSKAPVVRNGDGQKFRAALVRVADGKVEFKGLRAGNPVVEAPEIFVALQHDDGSVHFLRDGGRGRFANEYTVVSASSIGRPAHLTSLPRMSIGLKGRNPA